MFNEKALQEKRFSSSLVSDHKKLFCLNRTMTSTIPILHICKNRKIKYNLYLKGTIGRNVRYTFLPEMKSNLIEVKKDTKRHFQETIKRNILIAKLFRNYNL